MGKQSEFLEDCVFYNFICSEIHSPTIRNHSDFSVVRISQVIDKQ